MLKEAYYNSPNRKRTITFQLPLSIIKNKSFVLQERGKSNQTIKRHSKKNKAKKQGAWRLGGVMTEYDVLYKILMVGDSGVGKSSLLLRFTVYCCAFRLYRMVFHPLFCI